MELKYIRSVEKEPFFRWQPFLPRETISWTEIDNIQCFIRVAEIRWWQFDNVIYRSDLWLHSDVELPFPLQNTITMES